MHVQENHVHQECINKTLCYETKKLKSKCANSEWDANKMSPTHGKHWEKRQTKSEFLISQSSHNTEVTGPWAGAQTVRFKSNFTNHTKPYHFVTYTKNFSFLGPMCTEIWHSKVGWFWGGGSHLIIVHCVCIPTRKIHVSK